MNWGQAETGRSHEPAVAGGAGEKGSIRYKE